MSCYIEQHKEFLDHIKYYGANDFSAGFFVKNIVDNLNTLEQSVDSLTCAVNDLMSLYQYLWICSFKKFIKDIDCYILTDDIKNRIKFLDKMIDLNNKSFIAYVNKNFEIIFTKGNHNEVKWNSICGLILELVYEKFTGGITKDVYIFLEKNLYLTLLSKFEICKNYYSKKENDENFKSLFSNLNSTNVFDDKVYLDFLFKTKAAFKYDFLKEKARFICERTIKHIKDIVINSKNVDIYQLFCEFDEYYKLASLFKLECISDYSSTSVKLKTQLDDYLIKHGNKTNFGPIDLSSAIKKLKEDSKEFKFVYLTHNFKNKAFTNIFNYIFTLSNENNLSELFSELGNPRSEKYPYYRQHDMELFLACYIQMMIWILNDETLSIDLSKYLLLACNQVEKKYFNNEISISSEIFGSFEILENILTLYENKQEKETLVKALENGCTVNLCGTIEKILRNVLIKESNGSLFIDSDAITLTQILNPSNKLADISIGLRYFLEFYLATEMDFNGLKEERPGKNIRNIQMHNRSDKYEKTDYQTAIMLFFFLISLLNDLLVKTAEDN